MRKLLYIIAFLLVCSITNAGTISIDDYAVTGQVTSVNLNEKFNTLENLANGALDNDNANTSDGFRFVEVVATLPAAGNEGRIVYLTSDNILYTDDGSAFVGGSGGGLQSAFDSGQTITISDTDNQTLAITSNDTTNDPTIMTITNTSQGKALQILSSSTLNSDKYLVSIASAGALTSTGSGLMHLQSSNASSDEYMLYMQQTQSAAGITPLYISNLGTSEGIKVLSQNGIHIGSSAGYHLRLEGDPANASKADGDLWYTGSALNFHNNTSTVDLLGGSCEKFTEDGTFTSNASTTAIWVYMVGGGGGGGTFGNNEGGGGGGGGASLYSLSPIAVSASTGYNVQVGDAGAGGSGGTPAAGANGQDSTFGAGAMATALTANGGVGSDGDDGGAGGAAPTVTAAGNAILTAGGLVGYGILGYDGGNGAAGEATDGGDGGGGGGTMFGPGATGATTAATPAAPGANTGAGGGGAIEIYEPAGAGAAGIVIVCY